jgi:hypothetical protein
MAAIGSLVFCTACGNLLDGSSGDPTAILSCEVCATENKGASGIESILHALTSDRVGRYFVGFNNHDLETLRLSVRP